MAKETIESLCTQGKRALAKSDYELARQCYLQALGLRSDQPEVHYGLATVCFALHDLISAALHFKEVTRLDPLRAGAFINLGAVYNRLEQFDEAIAALRRGIQLDGGRAEGYYNLALVYRKLGQDSLAIQAYREATHINPRMADAHFNLANLYLENGKYAMAVAHYRMALEIRPNWDKARQSHDLAKSALAAEQEAPDASDDDSEETKDTDLESLVDPLMHAALLNQLHQATAKAEGQGRGFQQLLQAEVEPALKEMADCMLDPNIPASQMEACLRRFEAALTHLRQAKRDMQGQVAHVQKASEQFLKD